MTLGNAIAGCRRELGITQEALARQLDVTNQAVSKWESDICCPDIQLLPKLADIFGVSIDRLFGRETEAQTAPPVENTALPWANDGVLRAVLYIGHTLVRHHEGAKEFHFEYDGDAMNVSSDFSVSCGDVEGSVSAGADVNCGDVGGPVSTGGSVNCGDVDGPVSAGGSVSCGDIDGSVSCGGNLSSGDICGKTTAGGSITCGDIDGDAEAGCNITCGDIGGSVEAGVTVKFSGDIG